MGRDPTPTPRIDAYDADIKVYVYNMLLYLRYVDIGESRNDVVCPKV